MVEDHGRDRLSNGVAVDGQRVPFVVGSSERGGRHRTESWPVQEMRRDESEAERVAIRPAKGPEEDDRAKGEREEWGVAEVQAARDLPSYLGVENPFKTFT